jgi:dTMP kinase
MARGTFITFEGSEGVGKTTQIKKLEEALKNQGHDVVVTREPGGTQSAEAIRDLIFSDQYDGQWSPHAETLMMFAARAMHIKDVIQPAIEMAQIVICDRFIDSTRVYQGIINQVSMDFIHQLEREIVGAFMPSVTLILDVPAEIALKRVQERGAENNNDRGSVDFYQNLRDGFLTITQEETERCIVIDAHKSEDDISQEIQTIISERLH